MSTTLISAATTNDIAERGQLFYDEHLRTALEPEHSGRFVAIEPESGRHYLADTAIDAIDRGRAETADKLFYLVRVGSPTAHRIGGYGTRDR